MRGRASGPVSTRSTALLTITGGPNDVPPSREVATATRPAATQVSHRAPSGARNGVAAVAHASVGSVHAGAPPCWCWWLWAYALLVINSSARRVKGRMGGYSEGA